MHDRPTVPKTSVTRASEFAELCFHALAHIPLQGPERLFDPRYVAFAERTLPLEAREPLAADAQAIGAELERTSTSGAVQWLPLLHADVASFTKTALSELKELGPVDADGTALAALQAVESRAIEWLRADLLLIAEAFVLTYHRTPQSVSNELEALLSTVPAPEKPARVELALALGPRGRAFTDVVIVGAPAAWWCMDEVDRAIPAVLALHEHAVLGAAGDYVDREWQALTSLARRIVGHDERLRAAHQRWLARLDLDGLVASVVARGRVESAIATSLLDDRDDRAEVLRAARPTS